MNKYLIVGVCQVYNEIEKGNLERFFKYIRPLVDVLIAYDDCSTDGSYEYALEHADLVIRGKINNFSEEIKHKQLLLNEALKYSPQFILWLDVDEVLTGDRNRLEELCEECEDNNYDGVSLKEINLWRSHGWERIDSLYNEGWFTRIWSTKNNLSYEIKTGLHASMVPNGVDKILKSSKLSVIHYGFYDEKNISYKYLTYKKHGQTGYFMLDRLLDESKLVLNKVKEDLIPDALRIQNESAPIKKSFAESLNSVYKYRREILKPRYSIAC